MFSVKFNVEMYATICNKRKITTAPAATVKKKKEKGSVYWRMWNAFKCYSYSFIDHFQRHARRRWCVCLMTIVYVCTEFFDFFLFVRSYLICQSFREIIFLFRDEPINWFDYLICEWCAQDTTDHLHHHSYIHFEFDRKKKKLTVSYEVQVSAAAVTTQNNKIVTKINNIQSEFVFCIVFVYLLYLIHFVLSIFYNI